jgi:hypothetical protein
MRCLSCNNALSNRESVRKSIATGEMIDLCDNCFSYISDDVPVNEPFISNDDTEREADEHNNDRD